MPPEEARPVAVSPSRWIVPGWVFCTKNLPLVLPSLAPGADLLLANQLDGNVGRPQHAVGGEKRREVGAVAHRRRVGELAAQRLGLYAVSDGLKVAHRFLPLR